MPNGGHILPGPEPRYANTGGEVYPSPKGPPSPPAKPAKPPKLSSFQLYKLRGAAAEEDGCLVTFAMQTSAIHKLRDLGYVVREHYHSAEGRARLAADLGALVTQATTTLTAGDWHAARDYLNKANDLEGEHGRMCWRITPAGRARAAEAGVARG